MPRQNISFQTQTISLQNVINARELGGILIDGHTRVKKGLLMRGGGLYMASPEDRRRLEEEFHLAKIFDFRTESEVQARPDLPIKGAENVWLPAIDPESEKQSGQILPKEAYLHLEDYIVEHSFSKAVQTIASRMYTDRVINEYTQVQYAAFMQMITSTTEGAVYWHCSQGKDRTGLGAAFLLAALGADRETIMMDYAISDEIYRGLVETLTDKVIAAGGGEEEIKVIRTFIGVYPPYFEDALDLIDREYGSLQDYLRNQLLTSDKDIEILRERYLETF